MKFTIEKSDFIKVLQRIQGIVEKRNTMPILANVLINAESGRVNIMATDLEVFIKDSSEAAVKEEGMITVNARKLFEVIKELPEESVNISLGSQDKLMVKSGKAKFNILGLPAKDFPIFPTVDEGTLNPVDHEVLKDMIDKTSFAVSTDETRYNINGFLIEDDGGDIRMVATDGHRLAVIEKGISGFEGQGGGVILPRKGAMELRKLLEEKEGKFLFGISEKNATMKKDNTLINIRLFEGDFPDYKKVIPTENNKDLRISREDILGSLKRVSILSIDKVKGVKFSFTEGKLTLTSSSSDIGDATEEVAIDYKDEDFEIAFNARYFIDFLEAVSSDTVTLRLKDASSPGILSPDESVDYRYIIMPMRI